MRLSTRLSVAALLTWWLVRFAILLSLLLIPVVFLLLVWAFFEFFFACRHPVVRFLIAPLGAFVLSGTIIVASFQFSATLDRNLSAFAIVTLIDLMRAGKPSPFYRVGQLDPAGQDKFAEDCRENYLLRYLRRGSFGEYEFSVNCAGHEYHVDVYGWLGGLTWNINILP